MAEAPKLSQEEITQARAKMDEIGRRGQSDPAFAAKVKADTVGTLRAEGVPDQAIGELLRSKGTGDVSGYWVSVDEGCIIASGSSYDLIDTWY